MVRGEVFEPEPEPEPGCGPVDVGWRGEGGNGRHEVEDVVAVGFSGRGEREGQFWVSSEQVVPVPRWSIPILDPNESTGMQRGLDKLILANKQSGDPEWTPQTAAATDRQRASERDGH